jgi:hypothetical protein
MRLPARIDQRVVVQRDRLAGKSLDGARVKIEIARGDLGIALGLAQRLAGLA